MKDDPLTTDVPHDRHSVEQQLGRQTAARYSMNGFVDAYYNFTQLAWTLLIQWVSSPQLKFNDGFLARDFAVFDRWFTPIPTTRSQTGSWHGMQKRIPTGHRDFPNKI